MSHLKCFKDVIINKMEQPSKVAEFKKKREEARRFVEQCLVKCAVLIQHQQQSTLKPQGSSPSQINEAPGIEEQKKDDRPQQSTKEDFNDQDNNDLIQLLLKKDEDKARE